MGGTRCAVSTCNNTYKKVKEGRLLSLHSFPRDKELRDCWVAACRRGDNWNPLTSHICSDHFTLDDFEFDQRLQIWTGIKWKPKLKPGSIPSLKLPGSDVSQANSCATKKGVAPQEFTEQICPRETIVSNKNINVPSTSVKHYEKGVGMNEVQKVCKKLVSESEVIYSCSEFELYVSE